MKKTLVIERSTDKSSVALFEGGECKREAFVDTPPGKGGEWVLKVRDFLQGESIERIVVGTGPGSFAGIRAALAFAQGYAIGSACEVLGLPSPAAFAPEEGPLAVVGDARRGMYWIALFEGTKLICPVFQADAETLPKRVPLGVKIVTPDAARIDSFLKETFGAYYAGGAVPLASQLGKTANSHPALLVSEPLPVYLNPAVRL